MPTLHEQMKTLLQEVKTKEALTLFAQSGNPYAGLLKGRYLELMREKSEDRISFADWLVHLNRIHFALLELTDTTMGRPYANGSIQTQHNHPVTNGKQNPSVPSVEQKVPAPAIRQALRQGDLSKTIGLLLYTTETKAQYLHAKFTEIKRVNALGMMDSETWMSGYTQLYKEILALDCMRKTNLSQTPSSEAKAEIEKLLQEKKIEQALAFCMGFGDAYLLIQARFATLQHLFDQGVFYPNFVEKSKNRICDDLKKLMEQAPDLETSENKIQIKNHQCNTITSAEKLSTNKAAPQIRQAMRLGDTMTAVDLFFRTGTEKSALLHQRCYEAMQQYNSRLIDANEWGTIQARLCYIILCADWMRETDLVQPISAQAKSQIVQHLQDGEIKQALALCETSGDEYLLQQRHFEFVAKETLLGATDIYYLNRVKNQINYALQQILDKTTISPSDDSWDMDFAFNLLFGEISEEAGFTN